MKLPSMRWNTLAGVGTVSALPGVAGSVVTVLLALSAVWALILLLLRRFPPRYQRSDLTIVVPALLFVFVTLLAALLEWRPDRDSSQLLSRLPAFLPFVFFPLVLSRLRTVEPVDVVKIFVLGASLCGILALPLAVIQVVWLGERAEGGAGNAIPFGMVCAFFASISLLNLVETDARRQALGWLGFVSATICVLLSQSRGVLPIPVVAFVCFFWLYPAQRAWLFTPKVLVAFALALVSILLVASQQMDRMWLLAESVLGASEGVQDNSLNLRLMMWKHATVLIGQDPWFGYGLQNRRTLLNELGLTFSHFHNGFLTATVDSGVAGLAATVLLIVSPLLCVWHNPSSVLRRERLFMAIMLTVTYILGGMTNFIFLHDIYDSVFLWSALIVAVPLAAPPAREVEWGHGA